MEITSQVRRANGYGDNLTGFRGSRAGGQAVLDVIQEDAAGWDVERAEGGRGSHDTQSATARTPGIRL